MKKMKSHRAAKTVALILGAVLIFCGVAGVIGYNRSINKRAGGYAGSDEERIVEGDETIGRVKVTTLPLKEGLQMRRASFTTSGHIIYTVREGNENIYYVCGDDGSNAHELCRGSRSSGTRLLLFADNCRVLMGDTILECPEGQTLDTCEVGAATIVPINFPEEFSADSAVVDKWTEVIIAPDCEHFAWTIRRSDCGAVNAMGRLVRTDEGYEIADAEYISNMNAFSDKGNGELTYTPVIGGEVKQFVRGGTAISLVGSSDCGMGASVLQDVATGEVTQITHTPGYDETTLFSPDEKLGVVMTTRFSETSDPAVLGLMPRPMGQALHNILGQVYMYSVTGIRSGRQGNIGPALINIERSMKEEEYVGIDLSDPAEEWIFNSPLSWNGDGSKCMWMENERQGNRIRLQVAELLDYRPGEAVAAAETPAVGDYAAAPLENMDYSGTVQGKASGYAEVSKSTGFMNKTTVTVVYHDFSDDGVVIFNGSETSSGAITSKTTYTADLTATDAGGAELGGMDAEMYFSAAYSPASLLTGSSGPKLDTAKSQGAAWWGDRSADTSRLVE